MTFYNILLIPFVSLLVDLQKLRFGFVYCCSGMPECKLGLNDRVLLEAQGRTTKGKAIDLEDIKFHQYVLPYGVFIFLYWQYLCILLDSDAIYSNV